MPEQRQAITKTNADIIIQTLRNIGQWTFNPITTIFYWQIAFQNVVYKILAIMFRPQCLSKTLPDERSM